VEPSWPRTTEHGADPPDPPDYPASTEVVLIVDVANVMGSRPDGWWRDRKAAATRMLTALGRLIGAETAGPDGRNLRIARIVAVLEGAARGAVAPGVVRVTDVDPTGSTEAPGSIKSAVTSGTDHPTGRPAMEVAEAERDGDSTIVAVTEKLVRALPSASPETAERVEAVLVVTADRGLRRRLPPNAITVGPEWLNRLTGR
jgi:hypothetical protein